MKPKDLNIIKRAIRKLEVANVREAMILLESIIEHYKKEL